MLTSTPLSQRLNSAQSTIQLRSVNGITPLRQRPGFAVTERFGLR